MKKIFIIAAMVIAATTAIAQENNKPTVKLYGFIRNYLDFDSRENLSSNSDQFNMIPKDENLNSYGDDLNERADIHLLSITTRLGLNITGPEFLGAKTSAKIDGRVLPPVISSPLLKNHINRKHTKATYWVY